MIQNKKLDNFFERNKNKEIVVVQGLGFVGAIMALVVANSKKKDYAVIGVELNTEKGINKVELLNNGQFPIVSSDAKVDEYFCEVHKKGNFLATTDIFAYSLANIVIVDINLDVQKKRNSDNILIEYEVDLEQFQDGIRSIAAYCKEDVLIIIETTVPPGTTEKIVKQIFLEEFAKRGLNNRFKLAHSYERVMPGDKYIDSIENYYRVFAGIDENSSKKAQEFLETIINIENCPLTELKSTTASEMGKVLENSYRAMNIAFIQEWTIFAENAGVNLYEIIDAIKLRETHKNIMYPGLGVGGYCLTKDPLLACWASKNLFNGVTLSNCEDSVRINDSMPLHSFRVTMQCFDNSIMGKNFLLFGVSYLGDIADTRSTPIELYYDRIIENGAKVTLHDPYVKYWYEKDVEVSDDLTKVLESKYDCVVLTTAHKLYKTSGKIIEYINNNNVMLIDTNHVLTNKQIELVIDKNKLHIIGRGDI